MSITEFPVQVSPLPTEALEIYNTVQQFLSTLHSILQAGAKTVNDFDPEAAQKIRDFEYNWLSLFGFYKGITPVVSDFYFNYYKNAEFEARNGKFINSLRKLIQLLLQNATDDVLCDQINHLVGGSLKRSLFKAGVIQDLLVDLDDIVKPRAICKAMLGEVKRNGALIIDFLHFIQTGSAPKHAKHRYSEDEL